MIKAENIIITSYCPTDYKEVSQLLMGANLFHSECDTPIAFLAKVQHDHESILVARLGEKIVGFMVIIFDPWMSLIYRLVILPEFRRQGIAKIMMKEAEKRLKARGLSFVCFVVDPNNSIMKQLCAKTSSVIDYGHYHYMAKWF